MARLKYPLTCSLKSPLRYHCQSSLCAQEHETLGRGGREARRRLDRDGQELYSEERKANDTMTLPVAPHLRLLREAH